ncbi:MAG: NAD-dependent epimerase/dehydratase family protein [Deltaproteobacteria bacterium]|nr:NAD-dependent epimerase/dehydratase family protein [Deltaproteobacteria bacterium]
MKKILVTGSSGLIGSEAVQYFSKRGWFVYGIDNNMRADFFGPRGDTLWNLERLRESVKNFDHRSINILDRTAIMDLFKYIDFEAVIHCAGQPSHDLAKDRPFDDFEVNAVGTLNLLEAARRFRKDSPFVFMSTNKVYGDSPNCLPLQELDKRWEYADPKDYGGISETCGIDHCKHSLFGVSKAGADLMVQEYGRYFGMPTVCFRAGCMTGPNHSGVELHGFLSYLVKVMVSGGAYTIYGYKGKQVRDQIHSVDVVSACEAFIVDPRPAAVYNLGGGRENSASILECAELIEEYLGKKLKYSYDPKNREGDHICYISDLRKLKKDYSGWTITRSLSDIIRELVESEMGSAGLGMK